MTNKERNALSDAIQSVRLLSGADKATCVAIAQAIASAFDTEPKFAQFTVNATSLFTNVDYRAKLASIQN